MEGVGNDAKWLRISAVRQGFGGNPDDHLRDHHVSVNRIKTVFANLLVTFVQGLCGTRPIRPSLALHWRGDGRGGNNRGTLVRGGNPSCNRRNRAQVAAAGFVATGSIFRARALGCACAAGKILGVACSDEHGAALARSGDAGESSRSSCSDIWLVY